MNDDLAAEVLTLLQRLRSDDRLQGSALGTPDVRALSSQIYRENKPWTKGQIFAVCEQLLHAGDGDARVIAFDWAFRVRKKYQKVDFMRFDRWLKQYVDGWGSCDDFCTHAFGAFIYQYPQFSAESRRWVESENRWLRRGAAVVLIYSVRRAAWFGDAFAVAELLMHDEDDLVRKGYGWLLKEISNRDPQAVFSFVMEHKATMPRVSLRYAVEKLDPELRQQAMAK